jgi:hypothetical protein
MRNQELDQQAMFVVSVCMNVRSCCFPTAYELPLKALVPGLHADEGVDVNQPAFPDLDHASLPDVSAALEPLQLLPEVIPSVREGLPLIADRLPRTVEGEGGEEDLVPGFPKNLQAFLQLPGLLHAG